MSARAPSPARRPARPRAGLAYEEVYAVVRRIPRGRVATYGQIARLLGRPGAARQVGYALAALRGDAVPWHRVVNARGAVSPRAAPGCDAAQRLLLEREGVAFDAAGRAALARFGWSPRAVARGRRAGSRRPRGPARKGAEAR